MTSVFFTILLKIIPLYLIILLGYIAARYLKTRKEGIARLLIYIITPFITFYGVYSAELTVANLLIPVLFFAVCCMISLVFLVIAGPVFGKDSTKNILAFAAGTGNAGYFGLPVALLLFGDAALAYAVLAMIGFTLFTSTLGFYLAAKGNFSAPESLARVVRLPLVYAFFLGLALNVFRVDFGSIGVDTYELFKGAFTVLGMMTIGMGLAEVKSRHLDLRFLSLAFFAKFIVWPLVILLAVFLDSTYIHAFNPEAYKIFILISVVPLAAITVPIATELKVHPEKMSLAVFSSTIFALFYVPLIAGFLL